MDRDETAIDLHDDVLMGAVRHLWQTWRVAALVVVRNLARDTSRADLTFPVGYLATDRSVRRETPVADVPVILPRGGGYGVHFDVRANDPGLVVCCDGPVRQFFETGAEVSPQIVQGHDYGCAMMLPGGRVSSTEKPTPPPNPPGTMWSGAEDGSATIEFRGAGLSSLAEVGTVVVSVAGPTASVLLGSASAATPLACAPQTTANLLDLNTRVQAWTPVPNDGGASLKAIFALWAAGLDDIADAKVRGEGPAGP